MNARNNILIALALSCTLPTAAQAADYMDHRDAHQQRRIQQGLRSGEITAHEAHRLKGKQAQIDRMQAAAKADGHVSRHERTRIDRAQDRLARDIARESNDHQIANPHMPVSRRMDAHVTRDIHRERHGG